MFLARIAVLQGNPPQHAPRVQPRSQRHALGKAEAEAGRIATPRGLNKGGPKTGSEEEPVSIPSLWANQ
jgi:hypothetical protein